MVWSYTKEYAVLKKFAQINEMPATDLLITSGIFAFSYSIRTILNFSKLVDDNELLAKL